MRLVVRQLNKTFVQGQELLFSAKNQLHALQNANLEVEPGESLGIVGESGSGKTTLAKILAGFLTADSGSAQFGETNLLILNRHERAKLVQMVFQDPFSSLNPKLLLGTQLTEALNLYEKSNIKTAAHGLMEDVGLLPHHLNVYPHQLSGGQRQRFAIARALASQPKLLLADEPVSSLDVSVQAQIINLLNDLRARRKFSQILISHDLSVIVNTCERLIVMKDGQIIETGLVEDILAAPKDPYTERLLAAAPTV